MGHVLGDGEKCFRLGQSVCVCQRLGGWVYLVSAVCVCVFVDGGGMLTLRQ